MIELSELIEDLRRELNTAMRAAPSGGLRFALGSIDVELELAVEKSGTGRGGVKFWVLDLGGEVSRGSVATQRLKFSLWPQADAAGNPPYVSGPALPDEE